MTIKEKCAYLRGVAEGVKLDTDKAEGKLINGLLELCAEMADEIETLNESVDVLQDYVEELDEDLGDVEELVFDIADDECDCDCDDEEWEDEDDYDCDGECECCSGCDSEDDCDDMRCALCSECGDTICFDAEMDPEKIVCPNCGTPLVTPIEDEE